MTSRTVRYCVISHRWKTGFHMNELSLGEDPDAYMETLPSTYSSVMFQLLAGNDTWTLYKKKGTGKINEILEKQFMFLPKVQIENTKDYQIEAMERKRSSHESTDSKEDSSEDEGDEGDDEQEEMEPKLKYKRLGSSVPGILENDRAQCAIAHEKFLILGTHSGMLHLLDLNGNEILRISVHSAPINDMALDITGDLVATCSDDGKVALTNFFNLNNKAEYSYHRPVKAVALPRKYEESWTFVSGGLNEKLILNTKGWFSSSDNIIHKGEGPIHAIAWQSDLIAWANNRGVKVYDVTTEERITYIDRPKDSPRPELYRCCLRWKDDDTFFIGWADSVKIARIKTREVKIEGSDFTKIVRYVHIIKMFTTEFWICGIAPFGSDLLILAYNEIMESDEDEENYSGMKQTLAMRPELRIVDYDNDEVCSDALPIKGFKYYRATDYRLVYLKGETEEETFYYVVSPADIVKGMLRDVDDHISWFLERKQYERALETARANVNILKKHKVFDIGETFLKFLMETGEYSRAASLCPTLLGKNKILWETWILVFVKHEHTKEISKYIPITDPQLSKTIYEMILNHFLKEDHDGFLDLILTWPTEIYNIENVITAVTDRLVEKRPANLLIGTKYAKYYNISEKRRTETSFKGSEKLMQALAQLYILSKKYTEAIKVYIELRRNDVFDLVKRLDKFEAVRDEVLRLMSFNQEEAIDLYISNIDRIPVKEVVSQLSRNPKLQHEYLHALFLIDHIVGHVFHEKQISLYATYAPDKLLHFLKHSQHYILEDALHVCKENNLYPEMVFILKRMGNLNYALSLIIKKIKDVKQAINFVEEHKDPQLWEDLISESLNNPEFLSDLLEHAGSHYIDMPRLIRRIPNELSIPNLKEKIIKIISDHILQINVRKGCNTILRKDSLQLTNQMNQKLKQAIRVESNAKCAHCKVDVMMGKLQNIVVFRCQHLYHDRCLRSQQEDKSKSVCLRCNMIYRSKRSKKKKRR